MKTSKIKESIRKIIFKRSGAYHIDDVLIDFDRIIFDTNEYIVYYETYNGVQWSQTKEETIKLTEVVFNIED